MILPMSLRCVTLLPEGETAEWESGQQLLANVFTTEPKCSVSSQRYRLSALCLGIVCCCLFCFLFLFLSKQARECSGQSPWTLLKTTLISLDSKQLLSRGTRTTGTHVETEDEWRGFFQVRGARWRLPDPLYYQCSALCKQRRGTPGEGGHCVL